MGCPSAYAVAGNPLYVLSAGFSPFLPFVRRNFIIPLLTLSGRWEHSMSNDQPPQRYSRFSRTEAMPPRPSAEPSLEEIATRALNKTRATTARNAQAESYGRQPPPPPMPGLDELAPVPRHVSAEPRHVSPAPPPRAPEVRPVELAPAPKARTPGAAIIPELVSGVPEPKATVQEKAEAAPQAHRKAPSPQRAMPAKTKPAKASQGPNAAQRAMAMARAKAVPALTRAASRSALWVAHNLRRRELRKRYGEALVFAHNKILDRRLENLFFVPTLKAARIAPAPERGILYDGPVPGTVFEWAMASVPKDLREYAFIDFRAGRGRTMLLAARRNFDRIIGFEFDAQLFDDLQMNVAQYPRSLMTCRNIDCYRADLDGISIPDQPSVLYFSAAWREDMIPGIMDYVRETYQQSPRRLYVVLENADESLSLGGDEIFYRLEPALPERLKLRLLSPMDFQVYRTIT